MLTTVSSLHKKESVLTTEEAWNSLIMMAADKAFDGFIQAITDGLNNGEKVQIFKDGNWAF